MRNEILRKLRLFVTARRRFVLQVITTLVGMAGMGSLMPAHGQPVPALKGWKLERTLTLAETPKPVAGAVLEHTDGSTRLSAVEVSGEKQTTTLAACVIDGGQPQFCSAKGPNAWTETLGPRGVSRIIPFQGKDYRFYIPAAKLANPVNIQMWRRQ